MNDPVNNPKHYEFYPDMDAIEVIRRTLSYQEYIGYLKGNALKYRLRAGDKGDTQQDIDKSNWYRKALRDVLPNESAQAVSADVTPEEDEAWDEKRIDVIGQNGPTGEHYTFGSDNQTVDHEGRLYIRATDRSDYVFGHYGAYFEPAFMDGGPFVFVCDRCGEIYSATDEVEQCPGQPCEHAAGLHSYSSTKEAQCIDCKAMLTGGDDAKLTQHKRKSGVGPDT